MYKTKNNINFEYMPINWYKRRKIQEKTKNEIINIELNDFDFINNKKCEIIVTYDDETKIKLNARVCLNCTYVNINGKLEKDNLRWTVYGIDSIGNNIQLKIYNT